jgi:hypothetical protein
MKAIPLSKTSILPIMSTSTRDQDKIGHLDINPSKRMFKGVINKFDRPTT